jgi:Zn-finger protein
MGNYALQSYEQHYPEYPQFNNHSSMPLSYNHHPQESLVQHFPTAHIDDLEERVNQLMATRHAHIQPPHTHAPHQSCSYCYHPFYRIDDCPFINHYMIEAKKSAHENAQTTTILVSEEKAINKVEEKEEQIEPSPNPNLSNEKEVSTEAHSIITIPLVTQHEPQASSFQCLEEPSYV